MRADRPPILPLALATALLLAGSKVAAQDGDATGVIGPPQLREFELPGRTTTPAPDSEQPQAAAEEPAEAEQPVPIIEVAPPPVVTIDPQEDGPAGPSDPAVVADVERASDASPGSGGETAESASLESTEAAPAAQSAGEAGPVAGQQVSNAPTSSLEEQSGSDSTLPWWLVAGGLVGLAALAGVAALRRRRARAAAEPYRLEQELLTAEAADPSVAEPAAERPAASPAPQPAPTPAAAAMRTSAPAVAQTSPDGVVGLQIRPWLNLEFRPAQAAATLTEAVVQFELVITNSGNAVARNVRVEARMFNAGTDQDREISEFFARPIEGQGRSRILAIPPRSGARLRSRVAMPKEEVREITVEGRRLFIPMVAVNIIYEWGEGKSGQTSMSYLVGREPATPSTKMGAFRLDLGPRIYRSVGQRPSNVAVLV